MPAWVSIYCRKPVDNVSAVELLDGIQQSDYGTLAEDYGLEDELIDPALDQLRIIPDGSDFELRYRSEAERPLVIYRWTDTNRVGVEIGEALEAIEGDPSELADRVRNHMKDVCAVVGIELGFSQLEDMGVVFAYEVARWLGEHRAGLVKTDNENWCFVVGGRFI